MGLVLVYFVKIVGTYKYSNQLGCREHKKYFGVPMLRREPTNHSADYYFCVMKMVSCNNKKTLPDQVKKKNQERMETVV